MAKGKKTGGRDFAIGNKANPRGGGAVSAETKALRKITMEHIEEVADVILDGNLEKLATLAKDPNTSVLKVWLAKAAAEGIKKGDIGPLETILSRTLGRPKQAIDVNADISEEIRFADTEAAARLAAIFASVNARKGKA